MIGTNAWPLTLVIADIATKVANEFKNSIIQLKPLTHISLLSPGSFSLIGKGSGYEAIQPAALAFNSESSLCPLGAYLKLQDEDSVRE